jgi:hypothetical protein
MSTEYRRYIERTFRRRIDDAKRWRDACLAAFVVSGLAWAFLWVYSAAATTIAWSGPATALLGAVVLAAALAATAAIQRWAIELMSVLHTRASHEEAVALTSSWLDNDGAWHENVPASIARASRDRLCQDLGTTSQDTAASMVGTGRLNNRTCGFCGKKSAPIFCSSCGTTQWPNLSRRNLSPDLPDEPWEIAAFVAQFRWQILAAVVLPLGITIGPASRDAYREHNTRRLASNEAARLDTLAFLERTNSWRQGLVTYYTTCRTTGDWASDRCKAIIGSVNQDFVAYSWSAPEMLARVDQEVCPGGTEFERLACKRLREDRDVLQAGADPWFAAWDILIARVSENGDELAFAQSKVAAANLFTLGRTTACIARVLPTYAVLPDPDARDCAASLRRRVRPIESDHCALDSVRADPNRWSELNLWDCL